MKSNFLLITGLLLLNFSINAQVGLKAGVDLSSVTTSNSKNEVGFHLGAIYDLKMSNKFYFQPGLLFASNGFAFEANEVLKKANISMYSLELPLVFSFRPKVTDKSKLLLDFGLYARYGLFGKKKYEYHYSESINKSPFDAYNRFDTGINLGIGYSYEKITLSAAYQIGLTDAEKEISNMHHKKIRISLGYNF